MPRLFTCRECGHKMRFSGQFCGKCYARKETYQMPNLWRGAAVIVFLLILIAIML
ncbi:hypothetical protein KM176_12420 [Pseudooceanicola sp. CBS1P-1]|uniref:Uncharacterized protein n=1 Tax=Pseudooceanicola albus TaxID=2692189 RepID=A0A6L7G382_9RHOB|nr:MULTISPECIES: hypothetical protein [Pseudooceanicola]MBT9384668.1 hypothetical protein [Pseudooceanicola endophyticus]MXN18369.1 hypothetical protein [Pseudooceanicola albus]